MLADFQITISLGASLWAGIPGPGTASYLDTLKLNAMFYPTLTEGYIAFAAHRIYSTLSFGYTNSDPTKNASQLSIRQITDVGGLLQQAGWIQNMSASTPATADLTWAFGWTSTGQYLCNIEGTIFNLVVGGSISETLNVVSVPVVYSSDTIIDYDSTAANLCTAIGLYSTWTATYEYPVFYGSGVSVVLTSNFLGPDNNYRTDISGGNYQVNVNGGAWAWQSQPSTNGSYIIVVMTVGMNTSDITINETYSDGSTSNWSSFNIGYTYAFIANDYGFVLASQNLPYAWQNFYFTQVPMSPGSSVTSASFADWDDSRSLVSGDSGWYELNGTSLGKSDTFGRTFSVATLSNNYAMYNVGPIRTKENNYVVYDALCGLPLLADGNVYLCGWLWDCFLVPDSFPLNTIVAYGGDQWMCILSSSYQSVFIAISPQVSAI